MKISYITIDVIYTVELVGDRRLVRFLRGRQNNVELAAGMYREHLKWRKASKTDDIRNRIAFDGCNHPCKFPRGKNCTICINRYQLGGSKSNALHLLKAPTTHLAFLLPLRYSLHPFAPTLLHHYIMILHHHTWYSTKAFDSQSHFFHFAYDPSD